MRQKTVNLYQYSELSQSAQERARDWYRRASTDDNFFAESVTDDFYEVLDALGFTYDRKRTPVWSGFSSQGDGFAFTGTWYAARCKVDALIADRPATYTDENGDEQTSEHNARLVVVLEAFRELARQFPNSYGSTEASRYGHSQVKNAWDSGVDDDDMDAATILEHTETFAEACRDLAHHFYRSLESEYDFQNSDAQVQEAIEANEYEFTEDGERA